jgi:hypothetical protein
MFLDEESGPLLLCTSTMICMEQLFLWAIFGVANVEQE